MDDLRSLLTWILVLGCLLPAIILLIAGFIIVRLGQRRFEQFISPDIDGIEREFARLKTASPEMPTEQLVSKIIHRQALKCGIVGAITGFGGFFTLPIALPVDVILSLRIQAAMVEFIAATYGHRGNNTLDMRIRRQLVMSGSAEVAETAVNVATRFILRLIGKSLSKFVPFIGAAISFGVNYVIAQGIGRIAVRWYAGNKAVSTFTSG